MNVNGDCAQIKRKSSGKKKWKQNLNEEKKKNKPKILVPIHNLLIAFIDAYSHIHGLLPKMRKRKKKHFEESITEHE